MHTKERLARILELNGFNNLARQARQGDFDDFESNKHAQPKIVLVKMLEDQGDKGKRLAFRVKKGEFDNTPTEARSYLASPQGQDDLKKLHEQEQQKRRGLL